jgi:hypothetical protein
VHEVVLVTSKRRVQVRLEPKATERGDRGVELLRQWIALVLGVQDNNEDKL